MGKTYAAKVSRYGRLTLPVEVREAVAMPEGGTVTFSVEDGEVKLTSISQRIKRAQDLCRQYATSNSTVDDFIAERRAEAAREDAA